MVHLIFWLFYILLPFIPLIFPDTNYPDSVYIYFYVNTLLNITNFYIAYLSVKIDSYHKNALLKWIFIFFAFLIIFTIVRFYSTVGIMLLFGVPYSTLNINFTSFIQEFINTLGFTFVPVTIKFSLDWVKNERAKAQLISYSQQSEIAMLKNQLNPHFLFNTLNNIYSLVLNKSDNAPQSVLKLSEIMRYMIYDSNTEFVSLSREIDYIKSYIELQTLRFKNDGFVKFNIIGNITDQKIAPLLFISLVENAFKHCSKKYSPAVFIDLTVDNNFLIFETKNYIDNNNVKDGSTGIGHRNILRRLELIYPEKSEFRTFIENDIYYAIIKIEVIK